MDKQELIDQLNKEIAEESGIQYPHLCPECGENHWYEIKEGFYCDYCGNVISHDDIE